NTVIAKFGVEPSGCVELAKHVTSGCPNLEFCGLMTIGMLDYTSTPENFKVMFQHTTCKSFSEVSVLRVYWQFSNQTVCCQTLVNCRTEVCKALGIPEEQCELSMGMSSDFELAMLESRTAPSSATIASALAACAQLGSVDMGTSVHGYVLRQGMRLDIPALNSLVTMYAK
ncbi:hypothetical protein C1H46_015623, partial [Malus baccata]